MKTLVKTSVGMVIIVMLMITPSCGQGKASKDTSAKYHNPGLDIHTAAYLGDLEEIRQHLKVGTDLNKKNQYGSTPLIIAITFDKKDVAKALIEAGADLSTANNEGSTALHIAAFFCKPDLVKILLEHGADKARRNNYGATARESVAGPFEQVKPIYDQLGVALEPLGLKLDYDYLEATRPQIAEMLN